jgi:branched-chain amino acid transport system substrate-binding protein
MTGKFKAAILITLAFGLGALPLAAQTLKIGVSAPLTGFGASWGQDVRNVVLFANNYLAHNQYQVLVEDDHCQGRDAVSIAHKFSDIDHVSFAFVNCSATALASLPIYKKAGISLMLPVASSSKISELAGNVLRTIPSDAQAAKALHDYVAARHENVGIISEQADYAQDFLEDFTKAEGNAPLKVYNQSFLPGESDFKPSLLKFAGLGVNAIFIDANSEQSFAAILRQYRQLGLKAALYGALIPGSKTFLEMAGNDAEGIVFVDFPTNSSLTSAGRELYAQFVEQYGPPRSWEIAFAATFEAFRVLHLAVQAGQPLKTFVQERAFQGIFGEYHFDERGDLIGLKPALRKIVKGEYQELDSNPAPDLKF